MGRFKELALYLEEEGRYLDPRYDEDRIEAQMRMHLQHPKSPKNNRANTAHNNKRNEDEHRRKV